MERVPGYALSVSICSNCGAENSSGRKFCGQCAAPLARVCQSCGSANEPQVRFCGECGQPLAGESAPDVGVPWAVPSPAAAALVAERRLVSVLFADLVGVTAHSEPRRALHEGG